MILLKAMIQQIGQLRLKKLLAELGLVIKTGIGEA
jgi:hypothetical protein